MVLSLQYPKISPTHCASSSELLKATKSIQEQLKFLPNLEYSICCPKCIQKSCRVLDQFWTFHWEHWTFWETHDEFSCPPIFTPWWLFLLWTQVTHVRTSSMLSSIPTRFHQALPCPLMLFRTLFQVLSQWTLITSFPLKVLFQFFFEPQALDFIFAR